MWQSSGQGRVTARPSQARPQSADLEQLTMLWTRRSEARILQAITDSEARIMKAVKGERTIMTEQIAAFQGKMAALFATESAALDGIKAEEDSLKAKIADLQAKQAAGTFGPDDQAVLDDIEARYSALVARGQTLVDQPAAGEGATATQ
jgi:hypothetical protein